MFVLLLIQMTKKNAKYIGKNVINPINKKIIPIIADKYVDAKFGTGIMKCTPAHDFNDYLIGKKHKLSMFSIFNFNGTLNKKAIDFNGRNYDNITIDQARKIVVELLKKNNLLIKIQTITTNIGFSDRSKTIVEPMLSKQWFVKMKPLAKKVIALQKTKEKVIFYPKRFNKVLLTWLNNIDD
ncbi:class I tRNA ligase family protein [bacterium]|nr:class I tRNA ligase family protein [bacterium]